MIRLTHAQLLVGANMITAVRRMTEWDRALFWRARYLGRRVVRDGKWVPAGLEVLIANGPGDLAPDGEFLAFLGLGEMQVEDAPVRADSIHYCARWRCFELCFGAVIVVLPHDGWLPPPLIEALHLGRAAVTEMPAGELLQALDGAAEGRWPAVRWVRLRAAGDGYDLRVRLRGERELRTFIPSSEFPDPGAIARFAREAVGEGARFI